MEGSQPPATNHLHSASAGGVSCCNANIVHFQKDKKEGCEGSSDLTQKSSRKKQCLPPRQPAKETSWTQPRKAKELFHSYFGKTPAGHGCSRRPQGLDSFVQETTGNNPAPQTPAQTQGSPLTSPGKPYTSNAIFPVKKEKKIKIKNGKQGIGSHNPSLSFPIAGHKDFLVPLCCLSGTAAQHQEPSTRLPALHFHESWHHAMLPKPPGTISSGSRAHFLLLNYLSLRAESQLEENSASLCEKPCDRAGCSVAFTNREGRQSLVAQMRLLCKTSPRAPWVSAAHKYPPSCYFGQHLFQNWFLSTTKSQSSITDRQAERLVL